MTSFAPCLAASIAIAAPIPVDAPVTQTTCPFRSSLLISNKTLHISYILESGMQYVYILLTISTTKYLLT